MVLEEAVIARLTRNSIHFELLVDPEAALSLRKGKDTPIESVTEVSEIFRDARKGERASEEEIREVFHTADFNTIAKAIVLKGEIQLTTEQKRRMTEERKKEIAYNLSRQGINPQTKLPHPQERILNAMEQASINVDPFRPAREQIQGVLEKIREVIPISLERLEVAVRIPIQYAGKASSVLRGMADVKKEEWKSDSWIALIEIPAGIQGDVYGRLNELTAGKAEVRVVKETAI
jgi:ribosome maturation protein SDO1